MNIAWDINNSYTFPTSETYTFSSTNHRFQAVVNRDSNTVKIGGIYPDCVNITIERDGPNTAFLAHIESELECSLDTLMTDGAEMLKASIQFVCSIFPNIHLIMLDDMSQIDCSKPQTTTIPRKLVRPFSLPHLSIATSGYTWYEKHVGAYFIDESAHALYRNRLRVLNNIVDIPFEEFVKQNRLNQQQKEGFAKYYTVGVSDGYDAGSDNSWIKNTKRNNWLNLFRKISRDDRCALLFNWLPTFINKLTLTAFTSNGWVIDVSKMPKTSMTILPSMNGGKTRKQRKRRSGRRMFMTNADYHKL